MVVVMARFQARNLVEMHEREMSVSKENVDDDDDDALSDVEPLPASTLHQSSLLTRSWPSSPLSALSSSREVTARLYSSLQHSRKQEVKGHTAARMMAATPPLLSHGLEETQEAGFTADSSSRGVIGSGSQEAGSEVESEGDGLSQAMDLEKRNGSAQMTSGRMHIEEMENVRTHLQSILRSKPTAAHRHEFRAPVSQHLLNDSHDSDSTSHLLSAVSLDELFPRYSRLVDTNSSVSELQMLRESLERERSQRKVCEQQVSSLQNKVLLVQQQFTLAVAADRKKDIMIEQLDKMLVKVVEGWRRHDQDRSEEMKVLQEEKQKAERTLHKQRETLSCVEETLKKEQKHNQELQDTNTQLEQQVSELRVCVDNLQRSEQKLNNDVKREKEKLLTLQTESHNKHTLLEKHNQELQRQITQNTQELERERSQVKQEVIVREEAQSRAQQLLKDLEETRRDRDSLRLDRAVEQTRFESLKSQMEAEFRLSVEQKLNDQLSVIQEENRVHNTQLREQHRKQLLDLSARHERDLSSQLDQFRTQLQEKDLKLQHLTHYYQNKLSEMQEELVSMAALKKRLETQREELVSRLQGMMRSHWAEALQLLTNQEQMESVFVPSKISCSLQDTLKSETHLPVTQAVVLNLSRERESERETHGQAQFHSDLWNCSNSFTPLEPVLDNTHLTALSDCSALWVRPAIAEERENSAERKMKEPNTTQLNQSQDLNPNLSRCHQNHSKVDQNRDVNQRQRLSHAFTESRSNHSSSSDSGLGRGVASVVLYGSESEKAPPIKEEAPPSKMDVSSSNEDRQSELQYYVSKLLERSPGDPVEEPIREQRAADVTHQLYTTQQLQDSFSRSVKGGVTTVQSNLEHKSDEQTELTVSSQRGAHRVVQSRRTLGHRGGAQRVWR
nr:centrobin isoform X2 [Misgurnus anguillicaudatus]